METARNMIQRGRHSLEIIARETGFRDRRHLREVFIRKLSFPTILSGVRREKAMLVIIQSSSQ